jgi:hypothetical protein
MNKIDVIIDALSVARNSVWSTLNQEALAYAIELKLERGILSQAYLMRKMKVSAIEANRIIEALSIHQGIEQVGKGDVKSRGSFAKHVEE